jgi:hypothetical protein
MAYIGKKRFPATLRPLESAFDMKLLHLRSPNRLPSAPTYAHNSPPPKIFSQHMLYDSELHREADAVICTHRLTHARMGYTGNRLRVCVAHHTPSATSSSFSSY